MLVGQSGRDYIFATERPAGPRAALGVDRGAVLLQWGVALVVSGLICSLLTRYLTGPILQLREVSLKLAEGDLTARASQVLIRRRGEIGTLFAISTRWLRGSTSSFCCNGNSSPKSRTNCRSPLARLNVALDLGRERKGDDPASEQMHEDIELLDKMIGRLLTIAKLDPSESQVPMTEVDLTDLLSQISRNASFESRESNGAIKLTTSRRCIVRGNTELLHSAIENVVRNAIRYMHNETSIDICLECDRSSGGTDVRLSVRDYGPGVPESEFGNIFQPFYRVADARDRQSGGTGLGLAIADRVVRIHQGTIRAENVSPRGLRIEIVLPQLSLDG